MQYMHFFIKFKEKNGGTSCIFTSNGADLIVYQYTNIITIDAMQQGPFYSLLTLKAPFLTTTLHPFIYCPTLPRPTQPTTPKLSIVPLLVPMSLLDLNVLLDLWCCSSNRSFQPMEFLQSIWKANTITDTSSSKPPLTKS